jgi:hypothetical protein
MNYLVEVLTSYGLAFHRVAFGAGCGHGLALIVSPKILGAVRVFWLSYILGCGTLSQMTLG